VTKAALSPQNTPPGGFVFQNEPTEFFTRFLTATSLCGEYCVINFFKNRWVRFAETYIGPPLGFDEGLGRDALLRVHARFTHPFPLKVRSSTLIHSPDHTPPSRRVQQNYQLAIRDLKFVSGCSHLSLRGVGCARSKECATARGGFI